MADQIRRRLFPLDPDQLAVATVRFFDPIVAYGKNRPSAKASDDSQMRVPRNVAQTKFLSFFLQAPEI